MDALKGKLGSLPSVQEITGSSPASKKANAAVLAALSKIKALDSVAVADASGAISVRAAVSHALLSPIAYERLALGHIDELITTNSVPVDTSGLPIRVLSIASLMADAIVRINNNESVTSLFRIKGF